MRDSSRRRDDGCPRHLVAAMETQGAADAMEYDGVLPEALVLLVEA